MNLCGLFIVLLLSNESFSSDAQKTIPTVQTETIDSVRGWTSPGWGYNAPKIVVNKRGEVWTVSFYGEYGNQKARIMKRKTNGIWLRGKEFDGLYQPSMLFLDQDGRLNYLQNSQTDSITQFRSIDDDNLNNFEVVARGNGVSDGRGWYVGIGIHDSTLFMSYVTLEYDLFLTWKNVRDRVWHPAILIDKGKIDTITGNHSLLYPRFFFKDGIGYIVASGTVDGSKQNTYNTVTLVSFPLSSPVNFTRELVYDGAIGYYSYAYDALITRQSTIVCGHSAGRYSYGEKRRDVLPEGIYVSVKGLNEKRWRIYQVDSVSGGIALHEGNNGVLYAMITRGSWNTENHVIIKRSFDQGVHWQTVLDDAFKNTPGKNHVFFGQVVHDNSGSEVDKSTIYGMMSNQLTSELDKHLYLFEMLFLKITLPN